MIASKTMMTAKTSKPNMGKALQSGEQNMVGAVQTASPERGGGSQAHCTMDSSLGGPVWSQRAAGTARGSLSASGTAIIKLNVALRQVEDDGLVGHPTGARHQRAGREIDAVAEH